MLKYLYGLLALLEIGGEMIELRPLILATKPLLMPVLIAYHLSKHKDELSPLNYGLSAGFFFSWLGDVSLMFQQQWDPYAFLCGLGSFLIAHLVYIRVFMMKNYLSEGKAVLLKKPLLAVPYTLLALAVFSIIAPGIRASEDPGMIYPVAIYTIVILVMVLAAMNRFGRVNRNSFSLVLVAALLFMFSDSLIAVSKFSDLLPANSYPRVAIMLLYTGSQFIFSEGISEQVRGE